jgi:glycosyltransferase involved in cell wall biosynthesis
MTPVIASVIVPAHNAAGTIGATLEGLAAQDVDGEFEVIVVDDGSTDATAEIAAGATLDVALLTGGPRRGPAPARNAGAARARGETLAFLDADCVPGTSWLRAGLKAMAGADLVQGAVRADPGTRPRPFDRTVWVTGESGLYECASLFVDAELFRRLGGFEDWLPVAIGKPLAEDAWFGWRARRAGARTAFEATATADHAVFRRGMVEFAAERLRLHYFPAMVERMPELREVLAYRRWFLNRRSAQLDLALAGVAAAAVSNRRLPLLACLPYAATVGRSAGRWGREAPRVAIGELIADLTGFGALASGSVRRRTLLL